MATDASLRTGYNKSQTDTLLAAKVSTADIGNAETAAGAALNATYATVVSAIDGEAAATTVSRLNALFASGGLFRLVGDFTIAGTLTIPSDTTLDATAATITATTAVNMLRNENYASGDRDSNIAIIGGTWDRGANGGSNNGAHSLFLRRIDGITVRDVTYLSSAGKYGIALGDVTDFSVRDIRSTCASDTLHITGPASDGLVDGVRNSSGGDDVVAFTTTDYVSYDDVHGAISNVSVRNVSGTTSTRIVLIGGSASGVADGYDITGLTIEDVTQYGTGHSVWTGSTAADSAQIADLVIRRASGGAGITLRHHNHGSVSIAGASADAAQSVVTVAVDTAGETNIDRLTIRDCVRSGSTYFMLTNNAAVTIGTLVIDGVSATGAGDFIGILNVDTLTALSVRGCDYAGSSHAVAVGAASAISRLAYSDCSFTLASGKHVTSINNTATLPAIVFSRCTVTAADTSSGILVNKGSTGPTLGTISVDGCDLNAIGRVLEVANGSSGTVELSIINTDVAGCNRIVQAGGGTVNVAFANVSGATVNEAFRVYNSTAMNIRGSGWNGGTSDQVAISSAEVVHVIAPDLRVDVGNLTGALGDTCYNVNSTPIDVGPILSDGTTWTNLATADTYTP